MDATRQISFLLFRNLARLKQHSAYIHTRVNEGNSEADVECLRVSYEASLRQKFIDNPLAARKINGSQTA
jgi:hypothetical protein